MGANELVEKILADGRERVVAIAQERDRQVAGIKERSGSEAAHLRAGWTDKAGRDAGATIERARGSARLQLRNAVLAARWLAFDRAVEMARERVLSDKAYPDAVAGTVRRHAKADSEILVSESDVKLLAARLPGLKLTPARIAGGAIVRTGREEMDFSLDELLKAAREELAADLSRVLFGN
jgi:vacuolar-type H+-ATPase subunit E/Vma4